MKNNKIQLSNNAILITGGTSGIGLALAKQFSEKENKVIVTGRNDSRLEEAKKLGLIAFKCDLTKMEDIENLLVFIENNHPDLNGLINNAGIQHNYYFDKSTNSANAIQQEIQTNVVAPIILTQLLLPLISINKNSFIINVSSGLAYMPKNDGIVYSASKAALTNFTKGLKIQLKSSDVKVIEMIPPVTATNMTEGRSEKKMSPEKLVETILPQLEKGQNLITVSKMRFFIWLTKFFPRAAERIINK